MGIVNQSPDQPRELIYLSIRHEHPTLCRLHQTAQKGCGRVQKMPKPLAECFPTAKVASIATRGWAGKLKLKKRGNKGKVTYKPRKCLLPRVSNKKRQSSDKKLNGDQSPTKRSKSSIEFDGTAKVESTKTGKDKAEKKSKKTTA